MRGRLRVVAVGSRAEETANAFGDRFDVPLEIFQIDDGFVPEEYTLHPGQRQRSEPLYSWYGLSVCSGVGVPLGVAAEAFDTARALLEAKTSKASTP